MPLPPHASVGEPGDGNLRMGHHTPTIFISRYESPPRPLQSFLNVPFRPLHLPGYHRDQTEELVGEPGFVVVPDEHLEHVSAHDGGGKQVDDAAVGVAVVVDGHQRLVGNAEVVVRGGGQGGIDSSTVTSRFMTQFRSTMAAESSS